LDGSEPTLQSELYTQPIIIRETVSVKAATFVNQEQKGKSWTGQVQWHKALGKAITLQEQAAEKYSRGGAASLINGVFGSSRQFGDQEWLGFEGKNLEALIDLGDDLPISQVASRFFQDKGAWIHFPAKLEVAVSDDGKEFTTVGEIDSITGNSQSKVGTMTLRLPPGTSARFLKIIAYNQGKIPEGYAGAGYPAWLFAGEITVD
jgi:hexosaminidase